MSDLPQGWEWSTLADVAEVIAGPAFRSKEFVDLEAGIALLRGDNIEPGRLRWRGVRAWPHEKLEGLDHLYVSEGDVILAMDRPVVAAGLKLARVTSSDLPALLVQRVARIRPGAELVPGYVYALLQQGRFISHLLGGQTGTQIPHVTLAAIRGYEIPVPPLPEQRRIVADIEEHFSRLNAAEADLRHALGLQPILRDALWQQAFANPAWPTKKLEDLNDPERPIRYGILKPGPDIEGGVPYVKVRDYPKGVIDVAKLKRTTPDIAHQYRRATLDEGDLLISIRGTYGRLAPVPPELAGGNITQDSARIAPQGVERDYLVHYLRSPQARRYLDRVPRGVAVRGVNIGDLRPLPVPLAPAEDRTRLLDKLDRAEESLISVRHELETALARVRAARSSILAAAFSGQLVPQDSSDEPASMLLERIAAERSASKPPRKKKAAS